MFPRIAPPPRRGHRRQSLAGRGHVALTGFGCVALGIALSGCGTVSRTPPAPTPADFPGIAGILSEAGISVTNIVSGDAGCADAEIARTAIGFDASGADQTTPVRIHLYIFRNRQTFERKRSSIDECAAAFVTDEEAFESVDASPFVAAGQGPWALGFRDRFRAALGRASGAGG